MECRETFNFREKVSLIPRRRAQIFRQLGSKFQVVASLEPNLNHSSGHSGFSCVKSKFSLLLQLLFSPHTIIAGSVASFASDPDLVKFIAKSISYAYWTFLSVSILGTFGVDTKPFLSVVSLVGLALGFSAKDFIAHHFAGFFILVTKPFQRGDVISINGYRGRVTSIDLRYVKLLTADGKQEILIPNSAVYGAAIILEKEEQI